MVGRIAKGSGIGSPESEGQHQVWSVETDLMLVVYPAANRIFGNLPGFAGHGMGKVAKHPGLDVGLHGDQLCGDA